MKPGRRAMNWLESPAAADRQMIGAIIPVYNGARYLAEAVCSVLDQSLPPTEILIVDDGSTDDSAAIARSFGSPIRVLTQANLGPAAARNLGISHATGDLLAFLDADDLWLPDKLVRQAQVLRNDPACAAALGGVANFVSPELNETQCRLLARAAVQTGDVHVGALLIRREAFHRIGDFDTQWRQTEFVEWWARAMRLNLHYVIVPELVLRRRLHADNLTRRERAGRQEYLQMLREQLAQRRALAGQMSEQPE